MNIKKISFQKLVIQALICLVLLALPFSGKPLAASAATGQTDGLAGSTAQQPLASLLNPDGSLKLDTGFSGSLDPSGWNLRLNADGEPTFVQGTDSPLGGGGDENWSNLFGLGATGCATGPGFSSCPIRAIAMDGQNVYIGGSFTKVGNTNANNIAWWDSSRRQWMALGDGVIGDPANAAVYAITVHEGNVYVGGAFNQAGDVSTKAIARWNITSQAWSDMGGGMQAHSATGTPIVRAIAVAENNIYAGGNFAQAGGVTVNNIARWNITPSGQWLAMGAGIGGAQASTSWVYAVATINVEVYVGGKFSTAGNLVAHNIASWHTVNNTWDLLGNEDGSNEQHNGTDGPVYAIAVRNETSVYYGGDFTTAYIPTPRPGPIAVWPASGEPAPGEQNDETIQGKVYSLEFGPNGELYVGGDFDTLADGTVVNHVALWKDNAWQGMGTSPAAGGSSIGVGGVVYAIGVNASGADAYVGGNFAYSGGRNVSRNANGIARWNVNDNEWYALGDGVNGEIRAIAVQGDTIYIGGHFTSAGGVTVSNIASWNRITHEWSNLKGGVASCTGVLCVPSVNAIHVKGDSVYVGGNFTVGGSGGIAVWNSSSQTWSGLGGGVRCTAPMCSASVNAIAIDGNGNVYAGGSFAAAGTTAPEANNLAIWNASNGNWYSLAQSMGGPNATNAKVYALAIENNLLYAGGSFTQAGNTTGVNNIAAWNGSQWLRLGSETTNGTGGPVYAILSSPGYLIIAGSFDEAADNLGWTPTGNIYAWDSTSQGIDTIFGDGLGAKINALAFGPENSTYAGGDFTTLASGESGFNRVAQWTTAGENAWANLGSGTNGIVHAMASDGEYLYVGGSFNYAGEKLSPNLSRWKLEQTAQPEATTITLSSDPSGQAMLGQTVTLSAQVKVAASGNPVNGGQVLFKDNGKAIVIPLTVDEQGIAAYRIDTLAVGAHSLTAEYMGSEGYANSTSAAVSLEVTQPGSSETTTNLTVDSMMISEGQSVTLSASLTLAQSTAKPGGTITFYVDGKAETEVPLDANGVATWTTNAIQPGTHALTARYNGDSNYAPSTSDAVTLVVVAKASYKVYIPLGIR